MWGFFAGRRLNRLEERLEKVENDLRTANLDFDELYQKCRKLLGRTVKERGMIESAQEEKQSGPQVVPASGSMGGPLTERQKQIQQQILRRRAGA